jgi:hypothetical protein
MGRYTGDVNDAAAAAGDHGRAEFLAGKKESSDNVKIEACLPVSELNLLELPFWRHSHFRIVATRCVHQDSGSAEHPGNFFVRDLKGSPARSVTGEEGCLSTFTLDLFGAGQTALFIASEHGDLCTSLGEAGGQSTSQDSCTANYDRHFVRKIE